MLDPEESLLGAVSEQVLIDRCAPMSLAELIDALQESGFDLETTPDEDVLDELHDTLDDDFAELADGRWAYVPYLVGNRMVTHRLTSSEIDHDVLTINPDLAAIAAVSENPEWLRLIDGSPLALTFPGLPGDQDLGRDLPTDALHPFGSLVLPAGTVQDLDAHEGDLVSLQVTVHGIVLTRVEDVEVQPHPEAVRQLLRELVQEETPTDLEPVVLSICADLPEAFGLPSPSLTELFAEAGVAHEGDWLGPEGFDFSGYATRVRLAWIADTYELSDDEALCVAALVSLHSRLTDLIDAVPEVQETSAVDSTSAVLRTGTQQAIAGLPTLSTGAGEPRWESALRFLAEPAVAQAFLREAIGSEEDGAKALVLMAESLEPRADRTARPALRWLRAKAYERLEQVTDAEATLLAAERLDPDWPLTLLDLARYASDRGDSSRGLALLARAAPYTDPNLDELLLAFPPQPVPTVGRNEPCWCGSGRKFKQCHLHKTTAPPLEERAAWLYQKAARFLADGPWLSHVYAAAIERAGYTEDDDPAQRAVSDPLVSDAVLFEGGAFEDFVFQRGFLLPDDERLLAEQWLLVQRSLYDVTAVQRGQGFTVRDVRTGDSHVVRDRAASRQLQPGQLICARIVPAGNTMQVFGGIEPVVLHDRDPLLELLDEQPGPARLVSFLSRRLAPPSLVNTDRDPIVIRDVTLTPTDPVALSAALDQRYHRLEDTEHPEWLHERTSEGVQRIHATLRLTGTELHVNTNSDRRMDDVLATIFELDPRASVASDERMPIANTQDASRLAKRLASKGSGLIAPEDQPPEAQQALAQHIQNYERQWLDLPIPSLNGMTPREAAADPTRRDDLRRLLASFDTGDRRREPDGHEPSPATRGAGTGSGALRVVSGHRATDVEQVDCAPSSRVRHD